MLAVLIIIHIALFTAASAYALFLNQKHIYEWYNPDRTWITVVGGDVLIGLALLGICYIGALPWDVLTYWITLHATAGVPIIVWQRTRSARRGKQLQELDRRS